jgi:hypothetical protein
MGLPNYAYLGSKGMSNEDLVEFLLTQAESRYGPRFSGVTFGVQASGVRGALHSCWNPDTNHVTIRLPDGSEHYRVGQLAQESIHVLSPATTKEAKEFDRGLATLFAVRCFKYPLPGSRDYLDAFEAVKQLDDLRENAIRQLRLAEPRVALIGKDDILGTCSELPPGVAHFLVRPIY